MLLMLHILAAIGSLLVAGATYAWPRPAMFRSTYVLTGAMLGTGTVLTIQNSSHLVSSCLMGLSFLGVILFEVGAAKRKLRALEAHPAFEPESRARAAKG